MLPAPETFCEYFFRVCLGICIQKSRLRFPRNEAQKILEKLGEDSEENSGENPGRKFEKFGELSFCNFSDLIFCEAVWHTRVSLAPNIGTANHAPSHKRPSSSGAILRGHTLMGQIANRQSLVFSERGQLSHCEWQKVPQNPKPPKNRSSEKVTEK